MHYMHETPNRWVEAKTNQGWGVVGLVTLLTALCIAMAVYFYQTTYKHPTDPSWRAAGSQTPAAH